MTNSEVEPVADILIKGAEHSEIVLRQKPLTGISGRVVVNYKIRLQNRYRYRQHQTEKLRQKSDAQESGFSGVFSADYASNGWYPLRATKDTKYGLDIREAHHIH